MKKYFLVLNKHGTPEFPGFTVFLTSVHPSDPNTQVLHVVRASSWAEARKKFTFWCEV